MDKEELNEKLIKNLTDAHSIEEQALVQLRRAPEIAGVEEIARDFEQHLRETTDQELAVADRLSELGAEPSKLKDLAGKAGGLGMAWFADLQPDSPVKLIAHAYSYEHLEVAAYELLRSAAERVGDSETAELARRIGAEESEMAERLERRFPDAVDAVLDGLDADEVSDKLDAYLSDAHAIESQALQMLLAAPSLVDDSELEGLFDEHRRETESHRERIEARLSARGADSSTVKDLSLRAGALNLGTFFKAQPDTNPKLAGFAFAFEHLEIALYRMLTEVAKRAGDRETVEAAEAILAEERSAAGKLADRLEPVLQRHYAAAGS